MIIIRDIWYCTAIRKTFFTPESLNFFDKPALLPDIELSITKNDRHILRKPSLPSVPTLKSRDLLFFSYTRISKKSPATYHKRSKDSKKAREKYQELSKEEKNKKQQYGSDQNKNLSEGEKQRLVQYSKTYFVNKD